MIGFVDKAEDCGLQFGDGAEHAALEAPSCELGEEAFDRIDPGRRGRGEVERPARMAGEPCAHGRVLVRGVIVDDGVDRLSFRNLGLDGVEEPAAQACKKWTLTSSPGVQSTFP